VIAVALPVCFFLIFIFHKPREIKVLNQYLDAFLKKYNEKIHYDYDNAKISIENISLMYHIKGLKINLGQNFLLLPDIELKINFLGLLQRRLILEEIRIDGLSSNINMDIPQFLQINRETFSREYLLQLINSLMEKLLMRGYERVRVKTIKLANSSLQLLSQQQNLINQINFPDGSIRLQRRFHRLQLMLELQARLNKNSPILMGGNCYVDAKTKKNVCRLNIENIKPESLYLPKISEDHLVNFIKNLKGSLDIQLLMNFSSYTKLQNSSFTLTSRKGSFNLRQFFGGNINYTNLLITGETKDDHWLQLKDVTATLIPLAADKVNFSMSLETTREKNLQMRLHLTNAKVNHIKILWPVFLNDFDIRAWVIQHLKEGKLPEAIAYLDYDWQKDKRHFVLTSIKAEVLLQRAILDYADNFPAISELDARAVFSKNDMHITVSKAIIAKTTFLREGNVYLDFNNPLLELYINTKANGRVYEGLYFINDSQREEIRRITLRYTDGIADCDVAVRIPLSKTVELTPMNLKIDGWVRNNNTPLLVEDSVYKIKLIKEEKSNIFNVALDFQNSKIQLTLLDLLKPKGENLHLDFDLRVIPTEVLVENLQAIGTQLNFSGDGVIKNSQLERLNFLNVKYDTNNFNIFYQNDIDNSGTVIEGESVHLHWNFGQNFLTEDDMNFLRQSMTHKLKVSHLTINDKYHLSAASLNINFKKNVLQYLHLQSQQDISYDPCSFELTKDASDLTSGYKFNTSCKNFGSFLSTLNLTNSLIQGNLQANGEWWPNDKITGRFSLKNGFSYLLKDIRDSKFFNYIVNGDLISDELKNSLKSQNTVSFRSGRAAFRVKDGLLYIDNFLLNSADIFGYGISGKGLAAISFGSRIDFGAVEFSGLFIPWQVLNTLFGINKIPIFSSIIGADGGLLTFGYECRRESANADFNCRALSLSIINPLLINLPISFPNFSPQQKNYELKN
jgi:hypothetical protein